MKCKSNSSWVTEKDDWLHLGLTGRLNCWERLRMKQRHRGGKPEAWEKETRVPKREHWWACEWGVGGVTDLRPVGFVSVSGRGTWCLSSKSGEWIKLGFHKHKGRSVGGWSMFLTHQVWLKTTTFVCSLEPWSGFLRTCCRAWFVKWMKASTWVFMLVLGPYLVVFGATHGPFQAVFGRETILSVSC